MTKNLMEKAGFEKVFDLGSIEESEGKINNF